MNGIFVTGTDTGIGKTIVSSLLTLGLPGIYWKPIQSGLHEMTDTEFVKKWTGSDSVLKEAYRLISPQSPHDSARLESLEIHLESIKSSLNSQIQELYRKNLYKGLKPLIVEGAGGVLVPLNSKNLMIDLIKMLKFPCLIVAKSSLGTLNHTLLTISALKAKKIPILGVVLNGPHSPENKRSIEFYGKVEVLFEIPRIDELTKSNFNKIYTTQILDSISQKLSNGPLISLSHFSSEMSNHGSSHKEEL